MLIYEVPEIIPLLALPLAGASLQFSKLHLTETFVVPVVPLEDVLYTGSLLVIFCLFPSKLRFELGKILLDKVKLDHLLGPNT